MTTALADWKICLAVSGPNDRGGIERHVRDLANGLAQHCLVFVLAHESFRDMFEESVSFRQIRFDRWRYSPLLSMDFLNHIREIQPNIVHAHGRKAAQVVALTRKHFRSRCIMTVHNLNIQSKLCSHFDAIIAVSNAVAEAINHPSLHTVHNGC